MPAPNPWSLSTSRKVGGQVQPTVDSDNTQSQSQTIGPNVDDSDEEITNATPRTGDESLEEDAQRSKNVKLGKVPASKRRFTVDFNDKEDMILYTVGDTEDDDQQEVAVTGKENFAEAVGGANGDWYEGVQNTLRDTRVVIRDFASQIKALQEQNQHTQTAHDLVREKYISLRAKARETGNKLAANESDMSRMRQLRDRYRQSTKDLEEQNKALKLELAKATQNRPQGLYDSDEEPAQLGGSLGAQASLASAKIQDAVAPGHNKNYPDAPVFDGNRAKWEQWKLHVLSKFKQSAFWFPTEEYKIDYIRDKCTLQAFTVIQPRISPLSDNPYESHEQVLADLEENFGTHDKQAQAEADMQSPGFAMRSKDKYESFDTFHTRFAAAIAPLGYSDDHKMRDLKRYISPDLRAQVTNGLKSSSYREFVVRLRTCDLEMRQNSAFEAQAKAVQSSRGNEGRGGRGDNSRSRGGRGRGRGGSSGTPREGFSWPPHVLAQIQKKKLCNKCLKPGHFAKDSDAPCRGDKQLTVGEAEARLSAVGIEFELEAAPTVPSTDSEN